MSVVDLCRCDGGRVLMSLVVVVVVVVQSGPHCDALLRVRYLGQCHSISEKEQIIDI